MADEISSRIVFVAEKNGVTLRIDKTDLITIAGSTMMQNVQPVGTATGEAISLADVAGIPGQIILYNMDATNYVDIGLTNGSPITNIFAKLLAGQWMLFPAKTASIYMQANTAAVNVLVLATEL